MPLIQITLGGDRVEAARIVQLQEEMTHLMQSVLHKEKALTVVSVLQLPAATFSGAGQPLAFGISVQAMITAGTNNEVEKAAFIKAAYATLISLLGAAAGPVYVVLHEIAPASWGYDGRTQAARQTDRLQAGVA